MIMFLIICGFFVTFIIGMWVGWDACQQEVINNAEEYEYDMNEVKIELLGWK